MRTWILIGCLVEATPSMKTLQLIVGYCLLVVVALLGFAILWGILTGKIDLSLLVTESGGGASMSRFQLLVFTFVIALSFFFIVVGTGQFPNPIPSQVLTLLGISATTYGVSKGIQAGGGLDNKDGSSGGNGNGHGGADGGAGGGGAAGHD